MDNEITIEGLGISMTVVDTIVSLAAAEVDGVAGIGSPASFSSVKAWLTNMNTDPTSGVEVTTDEDGLIIGMKMQVFYGYRLADVAAAVRSAVADAVETQIGVPCKAVDIFIDGVVFAE